VTAMPPEKQGQYLPRQFLVNLMNGVPLSIWYDWHDDGQDPKDGEQNFGTVTWDYKPKPTYHAAQTLIKELRGYRYTRRLALPSADDYAVVFTNGPRQKLVFWTTGVPHRVSLEFNGARALDLTGDPQYLAQQ